METYKIHVAHTYIIYIIEFCNTIFLKLNKTSTTQNCEIVKAVKIKKLANRKNLKETRTMRE